MKQAIGGSVLVLTLLGLAAWMGGCPQSTTETAGLSNSAANASLTAAEDAAAEAAARGAASMAQAVATVQSPTGVDDDQASMPLPTLSQDVSFGLCPEVTLSISMTNVLNFSLALDFGTTGCYSLGSTDYMCTGSASGTFNQSTRSIALDFENISCESATLTGDAEVTYERSESSVDLDGDWDLTYVDSIGTIATSGNGVGSYDLSDMSTTISTFAGTVTDGTDAFTLAMTNIQMSYPTYGRYLPYAGEMSVGGDDIRGYVVRFDSDSPTTGVVEVSIDGLPFVEINVYALE